MAYTSLAVVRGWGRCAYLLVGTIVAAGAPALHGREPAAEFLEALRQAGYHAEAVEFLDRMATSSLASAEFKERIALEKGITLIQAAEAQRDLALREKQLDEAQRLLAQYAEQHKDDDQAVTVRSKLAGLLIERARMKVAQSKARDAATLLPAARQLYEEAHRAVREQQSVLRAQLEGLPKQAAGKNADQARLEEKRTQLRSDYVQVLLLAADIREATSETVPRDSAECGQLLADAERQYGDIYAKYGKERQLLGGFYARKEQGRVNRKLGKTQEALACFQELLTLLPDNPEAFRTLKTRTLRLAMECWLDPSLRNHAAAAQQGAEWLSKAGPTDDRDPDWLAVRLLLAKAYQALAGDARGKDARNARMIPRWLSEARSLAQFVARHDSEFQQDALTLVAGLGGPERSTEKQTPKTFLEAKEAGRDALEAIDSAGLVVAQLPDRIARETDPQIKAELQQQLTKTQNTLRNGREEAHEYFRLALRLFNAETPRDDVAAVHYYLAYLNFTEKRYYDAAVLGEFVARRLSASAVARASARIAAASYIQLHEDNKSDEKTFEINRLISIAEYTASHWPGQPEAEEANNLLVPFLISAGQFDRAKQLLLKIPEKSSRRGEAELRLGRAYWSQYLVARSKVEQAAGPTAAEKKENPENKGLEQLKTRALEALVAGRSHVSGGEATPAIAAGMLALAQVYVETNQAEKAVEVLEQAEFGPLSLLQKDHPVMQREGFAEEGYKTALRAYLGHLASSTQGEAAVRKTNAVMESMRAKLGATPEGQQRLTAIFVSLARELERELRSASPETRQRLSKGFETLLHQLSAGSNDPNVLHWTAETFFNLGSAWDQGDPLTPEGRTFYEASVAACGKAADAAKQDSPERTQIRTRRAVALRRLGRYEEALNQFADLLQADPRLVNLQIEAAKTCQLWAGTPGQEALYEQAILGCRPDPKTKQNAVWGWSRIANATASRPDYRDTFHEARYNVALCRYLLAESKKDTERSKMLANAEQEIAVTYHLFRLGDEKSAARYDELLKRIQKSRGKEPLGIRALESKDKKTSPPTQPTR